MKPTIPLPPPGTFVKDDIYIYIYIRTEEIASRSVSDGTVLEPLEKGVDMD